MSDQEDWVIAKRGGFRPPQPEEPQQRINRAIRVPEVRVIGADGDQVGIIPTPEAISMAAELDLDLVEVSPTAQPPVCRIMDYGKHKFELSKKAQEAKKKQSRIQVKEVKFRPGTDEGDYQVKLRNLVRFLEEGNKAKVTLRFRGREMAHRELGSKLLKRVEVDLAEYGLVEQEPQMEGRQMVMILGPSKRK